MLWMKHQRLHRTEQNSLLWSVFRTRVAFTHTENGRFRTFPYARTSFFFCLGAITKLAFYETTLLYPFGQKIPVIPLTESQLLTPESTIGFLALLSVRFQPPNHTNLILNIKQQCGQNAISVRPDASFTISSSYKHNIVECCKRLCDTDLIFPDCLQMENQIKCRLTH